MARVKDRTRQLTIFQTPNCLIVSTKETAGLIRHSNHGAQHTSIVFNKQLAEHGAASPTRTVGDSYGNVLAEVSMVAQE